MISRKSAKLIAEIYETIFTYTGVKKTMGNSQHPETKVKREKLYDFLYENEYNVAFLKLIKNLSLFGKRNIKELIMGLHTGESLYKITEGWTWRDRGKKGQEYLKNLAEDLIKNKSSSGGYEREIDKLISQLELDGYIFEKNTLISDERAIFDEEEEQNYIIYLAEQSSLPNIDLIKHHIELAEKGYLEERWNDCISNSRCFLEEVMKQIAEEIHKIKHSSSSGLEKYEKAVVVRDTLKNEKLIEEKERQAIEKVYGLLSDTGAHPNIAEKDQARLMRHLSLTFSQFILLRYDGYLKNIS